MYRLLEKYGYRPFMSPDEPAGGAGGDGAGVGAPAAEQTTTGATTTSEGVNTGDPAPKPAGSETQPAAKPTTALGGAAAALKGAEPKADDKAGEWKEYVDDPAKTADENKALKEAHDKTKPAEETAEAKAAREKAEKDGKAKEQTPEEKAAAAKAHGESITLGEIPEGFTLDPTVEKEFRAVVGEDNLSQATVDKLVKVQTSLYAKQANAHAERVTKWGDDLKADTELGGANHDAKVGRAGAVLNEFFKPEIAALMDSTGLGNHPEFVRGFYKLSLVVGELPTFQNRPGFGGKEDIIDVLYPDARK